MALLKLQCIVLSVRAVTVFDKSVLRFDRIVFKCSERQLFFETRCRQSGLVASDIWLLCLRTVQPGVTSSAWRPDSWRSPGAPTSPAATSSLFAPRLPTFASSSEVVPASTMFGKWRQAGQTGFPDGLHSHPFRGSALTWLCLLLSAPCHWSSSVGACVVVTHFSVVQSFCLCLGKRPAWRRWASLFRVVPVSGHRSHHFWWHFTEYVSHWSRIRVLPTLSVPHNVLGPLRVETFFQCRRFPE